MFCFATLGDDIGFEPAAVKAVVPEIYSCSLNSDGSPESTISGIAFVSIF